MKLSTWRGRVAWRLLISRLASSAHCIAAIVYILLFANNAAAQPRVTLFAEARNKYHSVLFTFSQDDLPAMEGCHYNLFAADKRSKLRELPGQGLSIATFYRALPSIQIIASPLPHVRSESVSGNPKVFFRVLLSCPQATNGLGDIVSLRIKVYPQGKLRSVSKLTKSMKYHMRYYELP